MGVASVRCFAIASEDKCGLGFCVTLDVKNSHKDVELIPKSAGNFLPLLS